MAPVLILALIALVAILSIINRKRIKSMHFGLFTGFTIKFYKS